MAIVRILRAAGVPDGVVNLVPTSDPVGVVTMWLADSRVRKEAVAGAMVAKYRGGGQARTAANWVYIDGDVASDLVAKFVTAVQALNVGPGSDTTFQLGPLISAWAVADARWQTVARTANSMRNRKREGHYVARFRGPMPGRR